MSRYDVDDPDFRLVSGNFITTVDDDSRGDLVRFFGVVESRVGRADCSLFVTLRLDGVDLLGSVTGPPHTSDLLPNSINRNCVPAFGRAVISGLACGVDPSTARTLSVSFDTFRDVYTPATSPPLRTEETREGESGWLIAGTLTPKLGSADRLLGERSLDHPPSENKKPKRGKNVTRNAVSNNVECAKSSIDAPSTSDESLNECGSYDRRQPAV